MFWSFVVSDDGVDVVVVFRYLPFEVAFFSNIKLICLIVYVFGYSDGDMILTV